MFLGIKAKLFTLALCVLVVIRDIDGNDEFDGGADGTGGNQFLDGTPETFKVLVGITCLQPTDTSNARTIELYTYQNDVAFDYSAASPEHLVGSAVDFSTCYLLNTQTYKNSQTAVKATASAACGGTADFTYVDPAGVVSGNTDPEPRTMTMTLTISDVNAASFPCGAVKDTDKIEVAIYCKRDINFDKDFDAVYLAQHSLVTGACLLQQLNTQIDVGDPPMVNIKRNYDVTFKAYKADDITALPDAHESPVLNEITAPVALGQEMYLEACLVIPPMSPPNQQFFNDGVSPLGLYLVSCTAKPDTTGNLFTADAAALSPTIVDADGCGTQADPVRYFANNEYTFKWFFDSADAVKPYLRTPNCFRSPPFEAVSFQRSGVLSTVTTIYTCAVHYCTSSGDTKCFGDLTGGSAGYPTCPSPMGRKKKREVITIGPDYPEEVSLKIDVILPGSNETASPFNGCFEKTAFISLTSVLTVLLVAVLAVAAYLMYKLRSPDFDELGDSSSGSGSGSKTMTGSVNKAFF